MPKIRGPCNRVKTLLTVRWFRARVALRHSIPRWGKCHPLNGEQISPVVQRSQSQMHATALFPSLPSARTPSESRGLVFDATVLRHPFSGVEHAVYELACALARHSPLPLCIHHPHAVVPPPACAPHVRWIAHRFTFQSRLLRILWQQCRLPGWLARHPPLLLHAPAYVAPRFARGPLVLTLYDLHVYSHPETCKMLNRMHYRALLPASVRRADAIIVPSKHALGALRTVFGDAAAAKATPIALGVHARFRPVTDRRHLRQVRQRHALPADFVLFVGNLAPRKNLPLLVEAWRRLRETPPHPALVLAGKGTPPANDSGLLPLGYVPDDDLPALYSLARMLVFPSIDEGYGLPTLEAMACACPVICTGGAPSEIAPEAVLSPAPTPDALADAMRRLSGDRRLRATLRRRGLAAARERTWDAAAQRTLECYAQVLANI